MADSTKRDVSNVAPGHVSVSAKKQKHAGVDHAEYVGEDILAWLTDLDADSIAELMSLLDPSTATAVKVRFADNPYSSPLIYHSSSFITINGNEETSGSSFSAAETLMASFDTRGISAWGILPECARGGDSESASSVGCGEDAASCSDLDDAMLARFLGEDILRL